MQVFLENIAFNHDPNLDNTGSFFLRRNETDIVPIPEWSNKSCSAPECAPAGYVISQLPETLTIKASFVCDPSVTTTIHIQALDSDSNILGAVQAMPVNFQNGRSGLVTFNLPNARSGIIDAQISVSDITWDWQFSENATHWTDFQTTEHRIYTVLEMPNAPWKPDSNSVTEIHVPWTEVLDYACEWAAGMQDGDQAAAAITRIVFSLGQENLLQWVDGIACYVTNENFDCTAFLKHLKRRNGKVVINCDDCATIVSTFSNVLGCNLFQSEMGFVFFTNPVLLIGHTEESVQRFWRHAVAWKLNCDESAALFDACLQVDSDGKPGARDTKHVFIHPTNLVFSARSNSYRFCLFQRGRCNPQPNLKLQRSFGSGPLAPRPIEFAFLDILKEVYEFDTWPRDPEPGDESLNAFSIFDSQNFRDAFDGWRTGKVEEFENERFSAVRALLKRGESSRELIEITLYKPAVEPPNEFLLQLLGLSEALHFERSEEPAIGDVSFVVPGGVTVLFRRGSFITLIRSVGSQQTPLSRTLLRSISDFAK